jgi:hypothetical protein
VGKNIPTRAGERVSVRLAEIDGINEVTILSEAGLSEAGLTEAGLTEAGPPGIGAADEGDAV